jgi:hypothetical protein
MAPESGNDKVKGADWIKPVYGLFKRRGEGAG